MRICVFLLPDSLPTVRLCLVVASALLLLLCSTTSCLGSQYQVCHNLGSFPCGDFYFGYPFGQIGRGCGDLAFQLECDDHSKHPLLDISGEKYRILIPPLWGSHSMTIVNDNLWGGKCNLSGNYSQFWWPGSHFQIADGYTNLTLWKHCDQIPESNVHGNLSLCGDDWYYSLTPRLNPERRPFCNAYQLPIQNIPTQSINNKTLLGQGFEVVWRVNPNRYQSCGACSRSWGICGHNTSEPFLCYCPNDNTYQDRCPFPNGNYSQFWWPGSHFQIADGYTNLTLWKHCDQIPENVHGNFSLCGDDWYYSWSLHLNPEQTSFCNAYQLPIKNLSTQSINNKTLLGQGFEVTWPVDWDRFQSCYACSRSWGICGHNTSEPFLCYCPNDKTYQDRCPFPNDHDESPNDGGTGRKIYKSAIVIGCSCGGVALIATAILFLTFYRKRRQQPPPRSCISKVETFLREYAYEMPTRYSQSQLKKMTNNFAEKLGEGGYGVVYKGKLPNGTLVAAKLLDRHRHSESTQFVNEVATIGRVHHVNLVRLLGYCFESSTSAVVYEYMLNGSLEKFIFAEKEKERILRWEQLYSIALGTARGIAYLHQDCEKRIIHFDIKPHNILLDAEFTPKVSDFGLAKLCGKEDDHISVTAVRGTPGYVAPEVCDRQMGPVTDKSDVYSFGMLLLEIVGGRKNIDVHVSRSSRLYFPEWAFKMLESEELGMRLGGGREGEIHGEDEEKARRLTKVGLWCIQYNSRDRPCMSRVVQMLEGNGEDVSNPPLPFNSSDAPQNPPPSSTERSGSM